MTWSSKITDKDGNTPEGKYQACEGCKHGQPWPPPCMIARAHGTIVGSSLTVIDVGVDGHMAGGEAILKCHGFEPLV